MMATIRIVCQTGASSRLGGAGCGMAGTSAGMIGCGSESIVAGCHLIMKGLEWCKGVFMEDIVSVTGVRTAIGKFQGALEPLSAPQLGSIVVREAVKRAKVAPDRVDECIMGLVVAAGLGQNPARQAALN